MLDNMAEWLLKMVTQEIVIGRRFLGANQHAVCNFTFKQLKKMHILSTQNAYTERECGGNPSPHLTLSTAPLDPSKFYQQWSSKPVLETSKYPPAVVPVCSEHTVHTGPQNPRRWTTGKLSPRGGQQHQLQRHFWPKPHLHSAKEGSMHLPQPCDGQGRLLQEGPLHPQSFLLLES